MHLNMQIINALQTHEDTPIRKTDHAIDVAIGGTHAADSSEHYNTKAKKFKKYASTKTRNISEIEHQKNSTRKALKAHQSNLEQAKTTTIRIKTKPKQSQYY